MIIQLIVFSVIVIGVFGYLYFMKSSGKLGAFQQNMVAAEADVNENYHDYLQELKQDANTYKPIVDIIASDFIALTRCKQPKSIASAAGDTLKTMVTGVIKENTNVHTLVLTEDKLHYIEYNTSTQKSNEHWEFDKTEIRNLRVQKGTLTDNLKQTMSFDLKGGGKSGDSVNNNKMKKLTFTSKDKDYEFFMFDSAAFGDWFVPEKSPGSITMNASKEDLVKSFYLPQRIAEKFFEHIEAI